MNLNDKETTLSLEELSQAVTAELSRYGLLEAQQDHRVSAAPDIRTIRYYTTLGLLDRPTTVARQARYKHRHILQILAIKALQGMAMPLAEIQSRLYGRSDQELETLLASFADQRKARPPTVRVVGLREVTIEPGLKIVVDEDWSPKLDQATLEERIRAALTALNRASRNGSQEGKNDEFSSQ